MYSEDALLPLSGLQHLAFCERQWALIHIEQQWTENRLTAEGRLLHSNADEGQPEVRRGVRIVRALALHSLQIGISGIADVVEFPLNGSAPTPVEYKRGRPKIDDWDKIQLCAQALCLEEMRTTTINSGAIFYWETRRRLDVLLDTSLREKTKCLAARMHHLYHQRSSPAPEFKTRCRRCSLLDLCKPQALSTRGSAKTFLRRALQNNLLMSDENFAE